MCNPELLHPIPKPPISVIRIDKSAFVIHPEITELRDLQTHNQWNKIKQHLNDITEWNFVSGLMDERTSVRYILSIIHHIVPSQSEPYYTIKELIHSKYLGLSIKDDFMKDEDILDFIQKNSDTTPKRTSFNTFLPLGPYVFTFIPHKVKSYHAFKDESKIISKSLIEEQQQQIENIYKLFERVQREAPCESSNIIRVQLTNECVEKPNLIYIANSIDLSNQIPCMVYRPSLNEHQMKTKLFMPKVRSRWNPDEIQTLMQTTQINQNGKYITLPRRGLFIWYLIDHIPVGTTQGTATEELETGDYLFKIKNTNQEIVIPPQFIKSKQLLTETEATLVKPVWALLHIHTNGKMSIMTNEITLDRLTQLKDEITSFIPIKIKEWKPLSHTINYTLNIPKSKDLPSYILSSLQKFKGVLLEKRSIVSVGNKVEWFSKDDQKWKQGTVLSYPDLQSYNIRTGKGPKTLPWTFIRAPKERTRSELNLIMERVASRRFAHPLATYIQELREKGYSIQEIVANLNEAFQIPTDQGLVFISQSLDISSQNESGVEINIPISFFDTPKLNISFTGIKLNDITYALRIFQSILLQSKETAETMKDSDDEDDDVLEIDEDMDLDDLELDEDGDDIGSLPDDDLDIQLEDIDLDAELDEGEDKDATGSKSKSTVIKTAFTQSISIFLSSLYNRDPALFTWQSSKKKDRFATICQEATRHPKMMTNEVKLEVDRNSPGAYGLSSFAEAAGDMTSAAKLSEQEHSCDGNSESVSKSEACVAIYHGTGLDKQWFICPRIYDVLEQRPLRLQDLEFEREYKPKGWKGGEWRVDVSGQDIEQFGPTYKGRGIVKNLQQSNYNQYSIYLLPSKAHYFYPGLLDSGSHPKMFSMPCCFKRANKRLEELYGIQDPKKAGSVYYVQGWKKTLGWDPPRLGLIPHQLRSHFHVHPINYKTGMVTTFKGSNPIWLRRGIPFGPNPFVECLANSIDDSKVDIDIRKAILHKINNGMYEKLNGGLLNIMMIDPNMRQSSYNNYRNHLLFGTNIDWTTTLDAYSRIINNRHVWILIDTTSDATLIDTSVASYHFSRIQELHNLQKAGSSECSNWKVFFAMKDGLQWCPIYKIKLTGKYHDIHRGIQGNDQQAIEWISSMVRYYSRSQRPTISNTIHTYPSPQVYIEKLTQNKEKIHPVMSTLSSEYLIGFYVDELGFLPFYMQKYNGSEYGSPMVWSILPPSNVSKLISFYEDNGLQSPFKAISQDTSGNYLYLTTVYGIEIPVESDKHPLFDSLPNLIVPTLNWRTMLLTKIQGQSEGQMKQSPTISFMLRVLKDLEVEYAKLSREKKQTTIRYIPLTFVKHPTTHIISQLMIRIIYNGKVVEEIPLPIHPTVIKGTQLDDLKKQVGVKTDAGVSPNIIMLNDTQTLESMLEYVKELKTRSHKKLTVAPYQYLYSINKVIGFENECGVKYMLHKKNQFNLFSVEKRINQFRIQPIHSLSTYETDSMRDNQNEVMTVFLSLFSIDYWKKYLEFLQEYAQTANIWKSNISDIKKKMVSVINEIEKRTNGISKQEIQSFIHQWIAKISWNDSLRNKVIVSDYQQSVSISQLNESEDELIVDGGDIKSFLTIRSGTISNFTLPTVSLSSKEIKISSVKLSGDEDETPTESPVIQGGSVKSGTISTYSPENVGSDQQRIPIPTILFHTKDDSLPIFRVQIGNPKSIVRGFVLE